MFTFRHQSHCIQLDYGLNSSIEWNSATNINNANIPSLRPWYIHIEYCPLKYSVAFKFKNTQTDFQNFAAYHCFPLSVTSFPDPLQKSDIKIQSRLISIIETFLMEKAELNPPERNKVSKSSAKKFCIIIFFSFINVV